MRVLLVIHGYPARYNAGSEVYTQTLARALSTSNEVRVFTRQEDPFLPAYVATDETDRGEARVRLRVVNNPESRDRYRHAEIDAAFNSLLDEFRPDVVHVNHVNHLSTSLLARVAERHIPLVYTLHDFWASIRTNGSSRTSSTAWTPSSCRRSGRRTARSCSTRHSRPACPSSPQTWAGWLST